MIDGQVATTPFPLLAQAQRLIDGGEHERGARIVIEHLRRYPNEPKGLALLGLSAMHVGALVQSEHFLRQAIARGENGFEVRRQLAMVFNQQNKLAEAEVLAAALDSEADDANLRSMRANLLDRLGHSDEAMTIQRALTLSHPEAPQYWVPYGHGLRAAAQVEEAIAAYRRAIAIEPEFGEAWWGLASIKRKVLGDEDIAAMRSALATAIDPRNSAPLHFALGRALHDRGLHEEAFHHYSEANRIRAESINYDAAELTDEIAETERVIGPAFISRLDRAAETQLTPIFIVSLPRSGSTLLEQMLGSHPEIEPVGELAYIPSILRSFMEVATRRAKITVPQALLALDDRQADLMGQDYLRRAQLHRKTDRPFFVDKMPQNWSNMLFIKRILPNARFVDIRRPAMDCCFSNFTLSFTNAHASSFALEHVGQAYVDYVRLMAHLDKVAPGLVHHVDYTNLVENQREEIAPVFDYLGLPWDDAVLNFHKLDRVVRTPSSEQVRRPLNRDGMDIWKPYSQWLGPLRQVLGELAEG